ncbi:MAG: beta-ketoacyl-ACP synthase [Hyphomicrobium sp.]|uniref:beta-ketoacyl-ACP synthase n=1 Tax=Hyphomicrobium sp. TaxID=82 RepID=UPI001327BAAF|nr:beta-ketoacyl-ACP synthase [Hyphomicrobium sp.]KAB2943146.1 MAG: beta-ketoacyl-ACP synthase [Hyphomicrobium sp.]MBZ0209040.1 beta-ketoacyl-ACP synthase [Hyphomicrobium sp.]MCZ7594161.1 beta-ketoacyl-ACP synthase [Hyphomicrobium sp.]
MPRSTNEVWVTGIGLVSSLGEDGAAHVVDPSPPGGHRPIVDDVRYAPYCVHPLAPLDYAKQIPKNSDQRQMEAWQRIGVYAAGLALADAGIAGKPDLLDCTHLVVAAGSGERDTKVDCEVLDKLADGNDSTVLAKEVLPSTLRPTLFLAQLSNMLAGNISIVHGVTASSRTFMGEEIAGLTAVENAVRRIKAGQAELVLVGGALNAEREDLLLGYELGHNLWRGPHAGVWDRRSGGGGFIPGSVGAFLMLESGAHARVRGAAPYARIVDVVTDCCRRIDGDVARTLMTMFETVRALLPKGTLPVLSGASGVEPATSEEIEFFDYLQGHNIEPIVRAYGSLLGHGVEAHFPTGLAMAALAARHGSLPAPLDGSGIERPFAGTVERVLVTGTGHWRGEGLALVEAIA